MTDRAKALQSTIKACTSKINANNAAISNAQATLGEIAALESKVTLFADNAWKACSLAKTLAGKCIGLQNRLTNIYGLIIVSADPVTDAGAIDAILDYKIDLANICKEVSTNASGGDTYARLADGQARALIANAKTLKLKIETAELCSLEPPPADSSGCPIPIPNEATHHVGDFIEFWSMPGGAKVGPYRTWYDKERTKPHVFKCYNKDGEPHGKWTVWNEKPYRETHIDEYEDGKRKRLERYHNDGRQITEETYENGKLDEWIEYNAYGKRLRETKGTFKEGKHDIKTGTITVYFIKSGKKSSCKKYKDGQLDGEWRSWHEEPYKPRETKSYKNGKLEGVWRVWAPNGKRTADNLYTNNKLKVRYLLDSEGNRTAVQKYSDGKLISTTKIEAGKEQ